MDNFRKLTKREKALKINLDPLIYGSFAEIGAGQEVAASFFKAGGASGTVAKTMSAYDMKFSDAIYGKAKRYVCEPRLITMLEREYKLLNLRLSERKDETSFFAFANTIETLNFKRTNVGHGWIGVRFQLRPNSPPNDCIIHIRMHELAAIRQQQAVGIVGVNLMYACFYHHDDPEAMINSLVDDILPGRVEIDMFRLTGPDFEHIDNRLMSLKLVKNGLTDATMFGPDGSVLQPSEALYKKNVLVLRGRFRPVTRVNMDMLNTGVKQFSADSDVDEKKVVVLSELTLTALSPEGNIDEKDFLDRADILCSLGQTVMISNFREFYRLANFLSNFTKGEKIGIILGIATLAKIFKEKYYKELKGGILESFGILFGNNVKMYVYPMLQKTGNDLNTCQNFSLPKWQASLFQYLVDTDKVEDIVGADRSVMHILSDKVLAMINKAEDGWEKMVPDNVENIIKQNCLFDYPCSVEELKELTEAEKDNQE